MDDYNARNHEDEIFEILVSDLGSFHLFPRREWSWEFARADFENGRRPEQCSSMYMSATRGSSEYQERLEALCSMAWMPIR